MCCIITGCKEITGTNLPDDWVYIIANCAEVEGSNPTIRKFHGSNFFVKEKYRPWDRPDSGAKSITFCLHFDLLN